MNKLLLLTGIALATITLAACSPGLNEGIGHRLTFDSNGMVVHAVGKPDAHVGKDGSLAIGDRTIDVTPMQRVMLQRYYRQAGAVVSSGKAMGREGAQMASHSIGAAIRSILHGDSASADKQLDAQSNRIDNAVDKLCTNLKAMDDTQQALATGIPAFAPYATRSHADCTHTTTIRDGNTVVAGSSSAATAPASPAHPGSSTASTSSEP
jgi:hypothetical protein